MPIRNFNCPETGEKCREEGCKIGQCLIQAMETERAAKAEELEAAKKEEELQRVARIVATELVRRRRIDGLDVETLMTDPKVLAEARRRIEASNATKNPFSLLKP